MRKFLFVLASTSSLATMNVAMAQYPASEYYANGYYVPGYYGRRYYAPGYPATTPPATTPLEDPLAQRLEQIMPEIQALLVVNAPKAFQRKLVDVVDRSTTRQVKTNQPG